MAKTDYTRDYYADLELPSTADVSDIKKQFRKLALKYHPDRNPGKEAEVNAKFQTIQAAHEILTSPEQKTKYDTHRVRTASRYPTASGVRGNPWQDVASQYPMPPRRPGQAPTSAARNTASASASSSSHRYSSFNVPPTSKTSKEDLDSRYTAWQNMRPSKTRAGQSASAAYAAAGANTGKKANNTPSASSGASSQSMPPPPPPRTASQRQKADASFGSRRGTGFVPRSPMGDEPPASNTNNYFTNRTHGRGYFFDEQTRTPPKAKAEEPQQTPSATDGDGHKSRTGSNESLFDTRQSTPYQTHGGEKFSLFEGIPTTDLHRAKSNRAANSQARPGFRRRSSSLPDESDNTSKATPSRKRASGGGDPEVSPPAAGPTPHVTAETSIPTVGPSANTGVPRSGNRTRPGFGSRQNYTPSSSAMPQFEEQYRKMQAEQQQNDPSTPSNAKSSRDYATPNEGANNAPNNKDGPIFSNLSLNDDIFSTPTTPVDSQKNPFFASGSAEDINTRFVSGGKTTAKWEFSAGGSEGESSGDLPSRVRRSQSGSRLGRRSPGKSNSIPRPESNPPPPPPRPPPRPTSSTASIADGSTGSTNGSNVGANPQGRNNTTTTNYFDPQRWSEQFGSEHFSPQPSQQTPQVPPRQPTPNQQPARPIKKPKPVQRTKTTTSTSGSTQNPDHTYIVIEDSDDEPTVSSSNGPKQQQQQQQQQQFFSPGPVSSVQDASGMESPVAMDIDSPPARPSSGGMAGQRSSVDSSSSVKTANGARNIPVEPTRPEWRAGNVDNNVNVTAASASHPFAAASAVSAMASAAAAAAAATTATGSNSSKVPMGGSEDSEEFRASLADIRKVEPFAENVSGIQGTAGSGLSSFGDLRTNLPFESKAAVSPATSGLRNSKLNANSNSNSNSTPTSRRKTISFPRPPVAPRPPAALAVPGLQPSTSAWDKYVADFRHYMSQWMTFNNLYVDHFLARRHEIATQRRQPKPLAFGEEHQQQQQPEDDWIAEPDNEGIDQYLNWMDQDEEVRARWSQSCIEHNRNVRQFKVFRDQMRQA